jgi:hypothetical protein
VPVLIPLVCGAPSVVDSYAIWAKNPHDLTGNRIRLDLFSSVRWRILSFFVLGWNVSCLYVDAIVFRRQERLEFLYESGLAVGKGSSDGFQALQQPAPAAAASSSAPATAVGSSKVPHSLLIPPAMIFVDLHVA